jgi:hypothetical protein
MYPVDQGAAAFNDEELMPKGLTWSSAESAIMRKVVVIIVPSQASTDLRGPRLKSLCASSHVCPYADHKMRPIIVLRPKYRRKAESKKMFRRAPRV